MASNHTIKLVNTGTSTCRFTLASTIQVITLRNKCLGLNKHQTHLNVRTKPFNTWAPIQTITLHAINRENFDSNTFSRLAESTKI